MTFGIAVIAEIVEGVVRPVTREVCAAAQMLANATDQAWGVVVIGSAVTGLEDVPKIVQIDPPILADAPADVRAAALAEVCANCSIILMAHTAGGSDLMGRVAQHLDAPLAADCTGLDVGDQVVRFARPMYGGKVLSDVHVKASPVMATLRPRAFGALPKTAAIAEISEVSVDMATAQMSVEYVTGAVQDHLDVAEADIVVSGGRGMQGPENWGILEDLVSVLGPRATLACSRPVSDSGWRPRNEHVGQTGRTITPDLYIACGISGAIQHVAGIARSKCIIAINKDRDAPIFKVADYGIVGDLFEVVPALTAAIRQLH